MYRLQGSILNSNASHRGSDLDALRCPSVVVARAVSNMRRLAAPFGPAMKQGRGEVKVEDVLVCGRNWMRLLCV